MKNLYLFILIQCKKKYKHYMLELTKKKFKKLKKLNDSVTNLDNIIW